ncbi:hypothetical protein [Streptomyces sp. enrichment culture]|uniref:hypothetical protein n=1 Tax=Streptomyces sp. enrichment culture TaxID=1795815 RepID=UPI003F57ABC4
MPGPRKHLARRGYNRDGLVIACRCGQYTPIKGTAREQEDAHRAHRVAMGETVKPRTPSRLERAEARIAAAVAVLDEYEGSDWSYTIPATRIREALTAEGAGRG